MKFPSFDVRNQRNIVIASCDAVPSVMIITGPNGCGKSTLLQALRSGVDGRRPMYIGPHRSSRRQHVRMRFMGPEISMRSVLEGATLPGYEGINRTSNERTPWDQDEAPNFVKYGLCQIEFERNSAIAKIYDKYKAIAADSVPDVWKPLRDMCENLLPHLKFEMIDISNRDTFQCLFRVHERTSLIDIDDLSSGEKSIIQLFYPIVEHRIKAILAKLQGRETTDSDDGLCVLMDEPELHLHPNLQAKILDYIRALSVRENAQFIMATHSPTIVESSTSDELYLLRPAEFVEANGNQLIRIASDDEKLHLLRTVFGATSNLTALRPVLVVEGRRESSTSVSAADSRIYSFLSAEFAQITIIPGGGKSESRRLVDGLNELLKAFSKSLRAQALIDRDVSDEELSGGDIHLLPVSMVENLMIDPTVIWDATRTVHHKMKIASIKDIEAALDTIVEEMAPSEMDRRIKAKVGATVFRLSDPVGEADEQLRQFVKKLEDQLSPEKLAILKKTSTEDVEKIEAQNKRREFFDGKKILEKFFKAFMRDSGMSREIFIYRCAEEASKRKSVQHFVSDLMRKLGLKAEPARTQAAKGSTPDTAD